MISHKDVIMHQHRGTSHRWGKQYLCRRALLTAQTARCERYTFIMKSFWLWEKAAQVSGTQSGQNLINTCYVSLGKCTTVLQKPSSSSSFVHYSICFVGGTISGNWREQPADNHRQRKQVNAKGRKKQCIWERGKVTEECISFLSSDRKTTSVSKEAGDCHVTLVELLTSPHNFI